MLTVCPDNCRWLCNWLANCDDWKEDKVERERELDVRCSVCCQRLSSEILINGKLFVDLLKSNEKSPVSCEEHVSSIELTTVSLCLNCEKLAIVDVPPENEAATIKNIRNLKRRRMPL